MIEFGRKTLSDSFLKNSFLSSRFSGVRDSVIDESEAMTAFESQTTFSRAHPCFYVQREILPMKMRRIVQKVKRNHDNISPLHQWIFHLAEMHLNLKM